MRYRRIVNGKDKHPEKPGDWPKYMRFDVSSTIENINDFQKVADLLQDQTRDDYICQNISAYIKVKTIFSKTRLQMQTITREPISRLWLNKNNNNNNNKAVTRLRDPTWLAGIKTHMY